MFREDGERSHSHGLPISVLQRQANALHIPLLVRNASWADYTAISKATLHQLKQQGIQAGVFGDIDLEDHRQWCHEVCNSSAY
jgi:diphthamide synthase (EF-2-diphthine--ammonia ligase)